MYECSLWHYTDIDRMEIRAATDRFTKEAGVRPNHKRMMYYDGTIYLELRYHPGDEAMEEGDGRVFNMRVALQCPGRLLSEGQARMLLQYGMGVRGLGDA